MVRCSLNCLAMTVRAGRAASSSRTLAAVLVLSPPRVSGSALSPRPRPSAPRFLREHGFWEYTAPCTGGFEAYDRNDYLLALDDMARAGMNSLMIVIKWFTTGLPLEAALPGSIARQQGNRVEQIVCFAT